MKLAGGFQMLTGLLCAAALWAQEPSPPELEVFARSAEGEFEFDEATGMVSDPAGVVVRYGDAELVARTIRLDRGSMVVEAEGGVRLRRGKQLWTGEQIRYDFGSGEIMAEHFRTGMPPLLFAAGEGLSGSLTNEVHSATNAFVTTDDRAEPNHRVRAKSLTFVPGKYVEVRGATFYLGKVPLLYLPHYKRRLDGHPSYFVFDPGYRTIYGPYLLSTYRWTVRTNLDSALHFDWRQKRGVGGGLDLFPEFGRAGRGRLLTYYTYDNRPGTNYLGRPVDPNRGRVGFEYSAFIRTNLSVRTAVKYQSDPYVIRDFFEDEYRHDVQPKSYLEVSRLWPNLALDVVLHPRVNQFYQVVERLPEVTLSAPPLEVGATPLYFTSKSSVGYYQFRYADDTSDAYSAFRADTFNQLTLPKNFFGWLNVAPRAGVRFTQYSDVDAAGSPYGDQSRWVFNTGVELSTKLSRVWRDAHSRLFEVRGLRHIIEPTVNYVFVPDPSVPPAELPQFDYLMPTYKLLPITYPQFNAIDAVDAQNVIRYGLRNRLQTKRDGQIINLVHWALLMDWRLDPQPKQSTLSDLYSDLDWRIRSWLVLNSETRFDFDHSRFNLLNHTLTIEPNDRWGLGVGHRYLREWPGQGADSGYDLLTSTLYFKANEDWAFRLGHHFDIDRGHLQEQYYTVYRDLGSWTGALVFRILQDTYGEKDYTVGVTFSLKAFPRGSVGSDRNLPRYLLGG